MNRVHYDKSVATLLTGLFYLGLFLSLAGGAEPDEEVYVCPPCGHDCLKTTFEKPGACGDCGMALVTRASLGNLTTGQPANLNTHPDRKKVAILIFQGVQIIDYTGPYEIFGGAGFEVFTVAKQPEMIRTVYGMQVTPDYVFDNSPRPDIVLVPGGQVLNTQRDQEVRKWLQDSAQQAEIVLSVCNGAFILAKAGLLNGLTATTTRPLVEGLAVAAPNIKVVHDTRFVDNGKVITSGGLSAGMDAALHIVARIQGKVQAQNLAEGLEYDWRAEGLVIKK